MGSLAFEKPSISPRQEPDSSVRWKDDSCLLLVIRANAGIQFLFPFSAVDHLGCYKEAWIPLLDDGREFPRPCHPAYAFAVLNQETTEKTFARLREFANYQGTS